MKKIAVLFGAVGLMLASCGFSHSTPERVKVTFVNYDDSVLYVTSLAYDGTATYQGSTPIRPATSQSHHDVFSGWDKSLEHVKIDTTFIAQYVEEINTYTVDFKNFDDTLLQSTQVRHGDDAVYSADTPVREATQQFTYTFDGWDKSLTNITSSQVIHAQYAEALNRYTVTFQNEDGTVLGTSTVDYGGTAAYEGATPNKEPTESHHFEFVGWDISLENIQDDCIATAQFKSEINQYTVRFLNYDNSELSAVTVEYDGTAVYAGEDPIKPGNQQYSYTFNGWNLPLDHVTSDREVVAQFTETINQYTVTFYNDDGTKLSTSTVDYGETAVYEGPDPEKEKTAKYSYAFAGWDESLENITEDCDRHAVYTSSINSYTVTFKNYDGSILSEEVVQYGDDAFYHGKTPTKAKTQQYTYTFIGWDGSLEGIVCDTTLTAQFEETVNQYTVTFKNYDGTVLYRCTVDYGGTARYNLDNPTREKTQQYSYAFTGWDISLEDIKDDCVATAQYLETTNQYTVTFKDWDGTILDTVTVDYGSSAGYARGTPSREETAQYSYVFNGWDISLTSITDDCIATAQYIATTKQYTVTFKNYDGTILGTSTVDYGETATYSGEIPTKPENQQYSYTFSGWNISLENITGNREAVAQFENVIKQYTVTFKNWDGSVLDTVSVDYGSDAAYPKSNPTRPATQQYTYIFSGWDISLNNITGNCIATAQYDSTVNQYTVTFKNYDGTVLGTKTVDYGTAAIYDGVAPTKEATAKYSYVFNGWDAQTSSITEDCVRIATFTEVINKYTVTFKNYDGTVLGTSTVEYGNAAIYQGATPTKPKTQQYTYTFSGWNISLQNITSNQVAIAQYNSSINQYTVTFKNYDGSVLGTSTVDYGSSASYSGATPTKPSTQQYSYTFIGWDKGLDHVVENYDAIAQFLPSVNQYTVTFKNSDGAILATSTVDYGSTATYSGATPTKESTAQYDYSFIGWDISLENVTSDRTATALYSSTIRQYTVVFENDDGGILDTVLVDYGGSAVYSGSTPVSSYCPQGYYSVFTHWSKATDNITEDTVVYAIYDWRPALNALQVVSDDESRGIVSVVEGSGYTGEKITIAASPLQGYEFAGWYSNDKKVSNSPTYSFWMPNTDYHISARFLTQQEKEEQLAIERGQKPVISQDGKQISYGLYPQTRVTDDIVLSELNSIESPESNGWYLFDDDYYAKRESYEIFWYKCEAIVWDILNKNGSEYYLLSDKCLDSGVFYNNLESRTIAGKSVNPNVYAYSDIRTWLNGEFYNTAFNFDSSKIVSKSFNENLFSWTDKVYMPSHSDYTNVNYGFTSTTAKTTTRKCVATNWAGSPAGEEWATMYWARSSAYKETGVRVVGEDGNLNTFQPANQRMRVRPSISIKI